MRCILYDDSKMMAKSIYVYYIQYFIRGCEGVLCREQQNVGQFITLFSVFCS